VKNLIFQIQVTYVTFFASRKKIKKASEIMGFDAYRTYKVVKKARVWLFMFIIFTVPFSVWACLAGETFYQINMPFTNKIGDMFDYKFHWLWYTLTRDQAATVVIMGAFVLFMLLGIEWVCWNRFNWEKHMNRSYFYFNDSDNFLTEKFLEKKE
jgi:hypothetical protein